MYPAREEAGGGSGAAGLYRPRQLRKIVKSVTEPSAASLARSRDFISLLDKNVENDEDKMMRTIGTRDETR